MPLNIEGGLKMKIINGVGILISTDKPFVHNENNNSRDERMGGNNERNREKSG